MTVSSITDPCTCFAMAFWASCFEARICTPGKLEANGICLECFLGDVLSALTTSLTTFFVALVITGFLTALSFCVFFDFLA